MTTESYRVRCDGCGTIEEVPAGGVDPAGWCVVAFERHGAPFDRGGAATGRLYGHLCGTCLEDPVIDSLTKAMPGYAQAIEAAERAATIAAEAQDRAAGRSPAPRSDVGRPVP